MFYTPSIIKANDSDLYGQSYDPDLYAADAPYEGRRRQLSEAPYGASSYEDEEFDPTSNEGDEGESSAATPQNTVRVARPNLSVSPLTAHRSPLTFQRSPVISNLQSLTSSL